MTHQDAPAEQATQPDATTPEATWPVPGDGTAPPALPFDPAYELLEELGHGGMGVVFKARQRGLNRLVAIKQLAPGAGAEARDRFKVEAEAVARLQHPNIVHIYEIGESAGVPYFSMEYVEGTNLAAHLSSTPLAPDAAVRLVEVLARAVHYAHERGIIHRDLKPSNVLLDKDGTPKVCDFGLAKRVDDESGRTQAGQIFGTPSYMAPEQADGRSHDVGPRSDVYALGALLYEALTGRPPFKGTSVLDTLEQVCTREPVAPRDLQPSVPRDLETICLKCLQKDPARRYASALALADDLHRFANGEPIVARRTSARERGWKWARRNRAAAALLVVVPALLLVTTAVSVTAAVWINGARAASQRDAAHARDALKLANGTLDLAANTITGNRKLRDRGFLELRKELLAAVLPHYEQLATLQTDDPALEAERARAYGKMGAIRLVLGENEAALNDYREMEAVFASLIARYPEVPSYQSSAALAQNDLAGLFLERGDADQARAALNRGEAIAGPLVRAHPETIEHHLIRIRLHANRAALLSSEAHHDDALRTIGEAEEFVAQAEARFPDQDDWKELQAGLLTRRGSCYIALKRYADAEQAYRQALALARPLGEAAGATLDQREQLAVAWLGVGTALSFQKRAAEEARAAKEKALALCEGLCEESPHVPAYRELLAKTLNNLAYVLEELGDAAAATRLRRRSLDVFERLAAGYPINSDFRENLGISYTLTGNAEFRRGKYETALEWLTRAADYLEPIVKAGPHSAGLQQYLAQAYSGRGGSLFGLGRYAEAIQAFDRALELDDGSLREETSRLRRFAILSLQQVSVPALRLARAGDHVKAAAAAAVLVKGPNAHPEMDYNAACVYAICAAKVKGQNSTAAEGYALQAVALLRQASARGFFKDPKMLKQLQNDKDLDPLRDRPDFKQVLEEARGGRP